MLKNKFLIFISVLLLFYICSSSFVFALEVKYPSVLGLPAITDNSGLPDYVKYFFGLGMALAGLIAIISFTIGAIQLIMSASSPEVETNAKDRIKGSVLGLVLTVSAFIILRTINLSLVTPTLTSLPGSAGIFYQSGQNLSPAPIEEANASNIPAGYGSLIYKCSESGGGTGPSLFIWKFPKANFQGNDANYSGVSVVEKTCGQTESLSGIGSFKTAFKDYGVYYFLESGCSGYMSGANIGSGMLFEPFKNNVKSIKIDKFWGYFSRSKRPYARRKLHKYNGRNI
jgi:hypothetical protein